MSRFHATAKGNVPFTAEEEATWDAAMPALSDHKQLAIDRAVDRQYQEADKGMLFNGLTISTTIASMTEITGAVQGNGRSPTRVRKINLRSGRVQMNKAELEAMADAVDNFRQLCHDRGYAICELIDAAVDKPGVDAVADAEIGTGWPG